MLARLMALIHQLKPPDRQLMLLYLDDLDAKEIGEITGLSPGAVATKIHRIKAVSVGALYHIQVRPNQEVPAEEERRRAQRLSFSHGDGSATQQPQERQQKKVGRNDPCPCGSGKKFKKCHGK